MTECPQMTRKSFASCSGPISVNKEFIHMGMFELPVLISGESGHMARLIED